MSSAAGIFVETKEYRRFVEFCDACRQYGYIGLCYGPPGVGKTLSARHYARWDKVASYKRYMAASGVKLHDVLGSSVVFYTSTVVNTPRMVEDGISDLRKALRDFLIEDLYRQQDQQIDEARLREKMEKEELLARADWTSRMFDELAERTVGSLREINREFLRKQKETKDPTRLIVIDEADRLKMASLEQVRAVFDSGGVGMVLIGMPGLEKRLARYPQLYSRIGFVHEFRPLTAGDVRTLLAEGWRPQGLSLPNNALADMEGIAAILRVTAGNFRLLDRLITQTGRILEINQLHKITPAVVDAARESLVIGTA
jgi:DNA transposition AAA+ family ATPase